MKYAIVDSEKLTSKTLRAQDYVFSPEHVSDKVLKAWKVKFDPYSLINIRSAPWLFLKRLIKEAVEEAYKAGLERRNGE